MQSEFDSVNNPKHYNSHPSGIECINLTGNMNFCVGNAFKYFFRFKLKNGKEDLKKCLWYLNKELEIRQTFKDCYFFPRPDLSILFERFNKFNSPLEFRIFRKIWSGQHTDDFGDYMLSEAIVLIDSILKEYGEVDENKS